MKLWWHALHQVTGDMAVNWGLDRSFLLKWAGSLEKVAREMRAAAEKL